MTRTPSETAPRAAVDAIVFDFGGVLIDWNPRHLYRGITHDPQEIEGFLREVGFDAWNMELDGGLPFAEGIAQMSARFPHRREWIEAFDRRWEECLKGAIDGTVDILRALKEAGYPLYGLSNWSAETFARIRDDYPFLRWLDDIVLSGEERVTKPDPAIFQILLRRAGRRAEQCLFIDDSTTNVAAADALGFHTVRFQSPEQLRAELARLGIAV
jgi:2-haloacid dehalogenase